MQLILLFIHFLIPLYILLVFLSRFFMLFSLLYHLPLFSVPYLHFFSSFCLFLFPSSLLPFSFIFSAIKRTYKSIQVFHPYIFFVRSHIHNDFLVSFHRFSLKLSRYTFSQHKITNNNIEYITPFINLLI